MWLPKYDIRLLHHLLFLVLNRVGYARQDLLTVDHLKILDVVLDLGMQLPIQRGSRCCIRGNDGCFNRGKRSTFAKSKRPHCLCQHLLFEVTFTRRAGKKDEKGFDELTGMPQESTRSRTSRQNESTDTHLPSFQS